MTLLTPTPAALDRPTPASEWAAIPARLRRAVVAVGAFWFAAWLAVLAPAQLAVRLVRTAAPMLQLGNVSGSFWHGSAANSYLDAGGQRIALGRLEWRLNPWSLLILQPALHVSTAWGEQMVDARASITPTATLRLRDVRALFPVDLLRAWAPLPARGQVRLNIREATLHGDALRSIDGDITWRDARWQWGAAWLALGDYRVQVHAGKTPGQLTATVSGKGDLAIDGKLAADLGQRHYHVAAALQVSQGLPQAFRSSLAFLADASPKAGDDSGAPQTLKLDRQGTW